MITSQYFLLGRLMSCDVFHQLLQTVKQHISLLKDNKNIIYKEIYVPIGHGTGCTVPFSQKCP